MSSHTDPLPAADRLPPDLWREAGAWAGTLRAAYIAADVALTRNDVAMIRRALTGIRDTIAEVMPEAVDHSPLGGAAVAAAAELFRRANLGGRDG